MFFLIFFFLYNNNILAQQNINNSTLNFNNSNKYNESILKEGNFSNYKKRNLESNSHKFRILIDSSKLQNRLEDDGEDEIYPGINNSFYEAAEILENLIKIKNQEPPIDISKYKNEIINEVLLTQKYWAETYENQKIEADLIIFVRTRKEGDDAPNYLADAKIIARNEESRTIIGYLIWYTNIYKNTFPNEPIYQKEILNLQILHLYTHFLGFDKEILVKKRLIKEQEIKRINGQSINKYVISSQKILDLAKSYYNCSSLEYIELSEETEQADMPGSHWEARILLGDYMTSNIYYPEQVISEFTLALLDELGWYEINYFTGGLMRFGKNKGCTFLTNDCISVKDSKAIPSFNDFCSYNSFGTCSSGRQSRSYCINNVHSALLPNIYRRNGLTEGYGKENVEYCPVSFEKNDSNNNYYYTGNCKLGNSTFGNLLNEVEESYGELTKITGEKLGNNSFCSLSSLVKYSKDAGKYQNIIRPTCYLMECGNRSLTIVLYTENENEIEYIVCPRRGGLIEINKNHYNYSKFSGYFFCPDYNLICTGTKTCNNLFDCIEMGSLNKISNYDYVYSPNNIPNEITLNNNTNNNLDKSTIIEGFEEGDDGICPQNCSQCLKNKRCTLCRKFNSQEPFAYYIGEVDNANSHINCSATRPNGGYYNITKYDDKKIHFFRCVENCNVCKNASVCEQCLPTHKIKAQKCVDKIENCLGYNESYFHEKDPENGNGKGYIECIHCDNDNKYFCLDMNKKVCQLIEDYNPETYYKMEEEENFSCIQKCSKKFAHCIKCNINKCTTCEPEYFVNNAGHCQERIPHCKKYDILSKFRDSITNGGGDAYKECEECDEDQKYFCLNMNKTICEKVSDYTPETYFNMEEREHSCISKCSSLFPYCKECDKNNCKECLVLQASNSSCFPPISNCLEYVKKVDINNIEYAECSKCNASNHSYCIDNNRKNCEYISESEKESYYELDDNENSCIKKCIETFPFCVKCNRSSCIECDENSVISLKNSSNCIPIINPPADDACKILIHDIDDNINDLDLADFIDYYFINTLPYTKHIDHFVNKNYTVTMFIYSDCTVDLLNKGYFKIDSNELFNEMHKMAEIESNEFLFSIFVTYNFQNHYTFYNYYSQHINEYLICPNCLTIPFTITNKYTFVLNKFLGPIISNVLKSHKINIFSKEDDIFTDSCKNFTLEGIDIPLKERLNYFYIKEELSTQIACTGPNCILEEVNGDIARCKCKMGNKFEDILSPIIQFENYNDENSKSSSSISESFQVIKCAKNGFEKDNILSNAGFFICGVSIVIGIGCIIAFFVKSRASNFDKNANPPPQKLKNQIILFSDWTMENNNNQIVAPNTNDIDLVQSRDEDDGNVIEEDLEFSNIFDSRSSFSINTEIGYKKNLNMKDNIGTSEKKGKKILVLLPNKNRKKKMGLTSRSDKSSEEIEFVPTDQLKKKDKSTFCEIYWSFLSIKQHIINYFYGIKCCKITDSYVPLSIRFIRSLFLINLAFLLNILFLNQNYFSKKFKYFNKNFKLIATKNEEYSIEPEEISEGDIPSGELMKYAFNHTIINALIVFVILIVAQFIVGVIFFSVKKSIFEIIKQNNMKEIKNLLNKMRIKFIIFVIIVMVLLIIFLFTFVGFGGSYGGGYIDYLIPGLVDIAFLQILPFIWSLILAIFRCMGIKKNNECCNNFSLFFMF